MTRQDHLLVIAMEECNEVAQRISKALRFGLTEVQTDFVANPKQLTNAERIAGELNDLLAIVNLLNLPGIKISGLNEEAQRRKVEKVERFLAYSNRMGRLIQCGCLPRLTVDEISGIILRGGPEAKRKKAVKSARGGAMASRKLRAGN